MKGGKAKGLKSWKNKTKGGRKGRKVEAMNKNINKDNTAELVQAVEDIRKDPKELEKLRKDWARMTARESKKGAAGSMTAMFMRAVRF